MKRQSRGGSLAGVPFGLLLFAGAMWLIWWNEGRINMADVAVQAAIVSPAEIDPRYDGELVAVSGTLAAEESLDDALFLRPGPYIALSRTVEMFAWEEVSEEDDEGGSSLDYQLTWLEDPQPPSAFEEPEGHVNPSLPFPSLTVAVPEAYLGAYRLVPADMRLPRYDRLPLSLTVIRETPYPLVNNYLFIGTGTLPAPELGDIRVSYWVLPADIAATAFARADGDRLAPYSVRSKTTLYRILKGGREDALQTLEREYQAALWGFRLLGFVLLWGSIALVLSPISRLLGLLPGLGRLSRRLVAGVAFLVAAPLALVAIVVSFLAHNPLALVAVLLALLAGIVLWQKRRQRA